ncbi:KH domain-containing, RNA-binding, signal transduction-associated protein 2-like isoform X4 [Haliotis cracherodii]|uniref:KH domain-containing, RNA-binding, signal transduction-associated protein 2-like isoform X4 n=1 Tax=Haliotis rufescens TaxID=6454 RepID=UPI001EB05E84|nr:KH domain-containing, RNA-binding, signal transduction-associated protein 2-like isoform X4 [Haliotis rufescens]
MSNNDSKMGIVDGQDNTTYLEELRLESRQTNPNSHAGRLLQSEISRIEKGEAKERVVSWIEVHPNNPQPLSIRVRIPMKEHPRFNFVGKLLGPKGSSLKRLQEETGTKMSILGKGSMRDKAKEDELRKEGGKYAHLNDELHVFVEVFSEMTDNYARLAHAVAELKKFLQPEYNDDIRQQQLQDMMYMSNGEKGMAPPRGGGRGGPGGAGGPPGGPNFRGAPRGGRGGALMTPPAGSGESNYHRAPRGGRGAGHLGTSGSGARGGPSMRAPRGGPPSRGMSRGGGQTQRGGMGAPRGRPVAPPQPVQQTYDDYSGGDYSAQGGYEDYGHGQQYTEPEYDSSYGGQRYSGHSQEYFNEEEVGGDTQYFDYGHGSGSAAGGYEDYGETTGDSWGTGSGPVKTAPRGAAKGQYRSHPYSQRGGY